MLYPAPAAGMKTVGAAVQLVGALIGGQRMGFPVDEQTGVGDAVGVTADGGAQIGALTRVVRRAAAAEQQLASFAGFERQDGGQPGGAPVHQRHRHAAGVLQLRQLIRLPIGGNCRGCGQHRPAPCEAWQT